MKEPVVEDFSLLCDSPVTCMTIDKSRILVGLLNAKLILWDKRSGERLKTLDRHRNSVRSVSMRQSLAISGSRDKTAVLWDLEHGTAIRNSHL